MTIRKKLIGIQLLTAFAVLILSSAVFVRNEIRAYQSNMVQTLSSTALLIGENTASTLIFLDNQAAEQVLVSLQVEPHIANACIYDANGQIFAQYNRSSNEGFTFPTQLQPEPMFRDDFLELSQEIKRNDEKIGTVFLRADLSQREQIINEYIEKAVGLLIIGMLLSVVLALLLQRTISRPVLDLVTVTETISNTNDYSQRVPFRSQDELGELSVAFNEMLDLIQKRDASLLEARDTLEQRIKDRTLELEMAKVQLENVLEAEQNARFSAEQARKIAETANQTKSQFLANISHEIRTPLNAILGYAQIMANAQDLPEEHKRSIFTITDSGRHLLELINDVLDISKIEAGREDLNTHAFDLQELVHSLASMFAMRCKDQNLEWQLDEHLPTATVRGDESKLRQVLINLLGNAVKFTEKGHIKLRVFQHSNDQYTFEVVDTGPGIAHENQSLIFEPFQQDTEGFRQGGTGLGLAIARRQVELMGGRLNLNSTLGEGTRFFFTLTLPETDEASIITPKEETDLQEWSTVQHLAQGHSVRALVVDDVANNRDILFQILTNIGVDVTLANSGEEAIVKVREDMPDIVFMDIQMPGIDGTQAMQILFEEHGKDALKIVAVTASVFEHQRQRFKEAGFNGFVDKPLRIEQIYACLAQLLNVEFDHTQPSNISPTADPSTDWQQLTLPQSLYDDLVSTTETYSVTELRKHIDDLEKFEPGGHTLAERFRELALQFDMDSIREILDTLQQEKS